MSDILPLDMKGSQALNEDDDHPLAHALDNDSSTLLASDADAQLIVTLALQTVSRVARVVITAPNDDRAPKTLKLFSNRATLDFSDAESGEPTQTFVLHAADSGDNVPAAPSDKSAPHHVKFEVASEGGGKLVTAELPLHLVKWRQVTHLSIFVEDNQSDDEDSVTALSGISLHAAEPVVKHAEMLNTATFDAALAAAGDATVFVDFTAGWCGPCQRIAPTYQALADSTPSAKFYKVDVDASSEISKKYSVSSMPTFIAFKAGQEVDRMKGADEAALKAFVAKNA